jgi:ATP-dependent DNA helicase RecG
VKPGRLEKLGLRTQLDYVLHLPLRYEDETRLTELQDAPPGQPVQVQARVAKAEVAYRPRRQLIVHAEGLVLRFFNFYGSQLKQFQRAADEGKCVRAFGELRGGFFGAEMAHPRYKIVSADEPLPGELTPIYPTTAGVSQKEIRDRVLEALDAAELDDTLPEAIRRRNQLADFDAAVLLLHRPPPGTATAPLAAAWRRVKFDELLAQQLSMKFAYRKRRSRQAPVLPNNGPLLKAFLTKLPFKLTRAQSRVLGEVLRDIAQPHPMQRLLQGDVGSGKTIVAAIACLAAADAGWQAAVMAPTEILSEQHFRKFSEWFAPLGLRLAWLHGGVKNKERSKVREAQIVIGTHALIQEGVEFARLGLAVVDEQHRFGVQQRLTLKRKADEAVPHQLMMSATPIPRTLSMTYFADLDVSTIDEMPPGRRPVRTRRFSAQRRDEVLARIREACAEGEQAYWVCPVIEESKEGLQTALDTYEKLVKELKGLKVDLLHGRLPGSEKAAIMERFQKNKTKLLVCTTVIEVGVDVRNASLMVIESAERFGLAQLHQLRGRVGRGARDSVCILLYGAKLSATARERLKVIFENNDGFVVAERDLALRGPGEFLGERQSGDPLLRFADLTLDQDLVLAAQQSAAELIEKDPAAAGKHVQRWLGSRQELIGA